MSSIFPSREESQPKFVWRALYEDGSILCQHKEEAGETKEISTEQISRSGLRSYELLDNDEIVASFTFLPGDRVAFRRRTVMQANEGVQARYYIVATTRDDFCTMCFLHEETRVVRIERTHLSKPNTTSALYYPTSGADTDKIPIE